MPTTAIAISPQQYILPTNATGYKKVIGLRDENDPKTLVRWFHANLTDNKLNANDKTEDIDEVNNFYTRTIVVGTKLEMSLNFKWDPTSEVQQFIETKFGTSSARDIIVSIYFPVLDVVYDVPGTLIFDGSYQSGGVREGLSTECKVVLKQWIPTNFAPYKFTMGTVAQGTNPDTVKLTGSKIENIPSSITSAKYLVLADNGIDQIVAETTATITNGVIDIATIDNLPQNKVAIIKLYKDNNTTYVKLPFMVGARPSTK